MNTDREALDMVRDQAQRFLAGYATPDHLKKLLEDPGSFDRALWDQARELGWPAAAIAEDAGGLGLTLEALCLLAEIGGRYTISLPLVGAAIVADALAGHARADDYLAALAAGEQIACLAFGEPGEAGIPDAPEVHFDGQRVWGRKATAPFGAVANLALCHARADDGVALLLVDLNGAGFSRGIASALDNARAGATLIFDGAPAIRIDSGNGWEATMRAAALAAIVVSFEQVGGSHQCLDLAVSYAKERQVFGQQIGRFQAIKHKLSDIYTELEIARGCAIDALGSALHNGGNLVPMAAMARLAGIRAYEFAARETVQTYGGIGVTWEAEPQHHYRRSRSLAVELGSAPFWRDILVDGIFSLADPE